MTSLRRVSVCALALLACAFPLAAASANGFFQFDSDGFTKTIEFNVQAIGTNGRATGEMTFNGPTKLYEQDVDGQGTAGRYGVADVTMKVELDCLRVKGNRAVVSGRISDSSIRGYVGRHVILAVEDTSDPKKTDRFTWGFYGSADMDWTPQDSEAPGEQGWFSTWQATDAEREDDEPVPATRPHDVACRSFSLAAYDWNALGKDAGDIQVAP